jgi:Sec-independent protein translocase protein TatA
MFRQIRTGEIIVVVVVLVFLFGAKILPEPARSIEKSARELRKSLEVDLDDQDEPEA